MQKRLCPVCDESVPKKNKKYCSKPCQEEDKRAIRLGKLLRGETIEKDDTKFFCNTSDGPHPPVEYDFYKSDLYQPEEKATLPNPEELPARYLKSCYDLWVSLHDDENDEDAGRRIL